MPVALTNLPDRPLSQQPPRKRWTRAECAAKPNELALVVEVADTTLQFDLTTKARLYARAGVADYWVLDLNGRRMIVHREPQAGEYKSVEAYRENERVAPIAAPDQALLVRDVLV